MQSNIKRKSINLQTEFDIEDFIIAKNVRDTFYCGMSRIALSAPDQHSMVYDHITPDKRYSYCEIDIKTLKLEYAIDVWYRAVLISKKNPSKMLYYWWLSFKDVNGSPFRKIEYYQFNQDITVEQVMEMFWQTLQEIADSGEIFVCEGYRIEGQNNSRFNDYKIKCNIVIDNSSAKDVEILDVFTYEFDKTPRTFKWNEIKDMFVELTLDQLRLVNHEKLHELRTVDEEMFRAVQDLDLERLKEAIKNGADPLRLDEYGISAISEAIDYSRDSTVGGAERANLIEIIKVLLDNGADINSFGYDGMPPLAEAYFAENPELFKFLIDNGADPNINSYIDTLEHKREIYIKSSILDYIDGLLSDEYTDEIDKMYQLAREAGGRHYVWGYDPNLNAIINKFIVNVKVSSKLGVYFSDNGDDLIGDVNCITIDDIDGITHDINISDIEGIADWSNKATTALYEPNFDWETWHNTGARIVNEIRHRIPEYVELLYFDLSVPMVGYCNDSTPYWNYRNASE